MVECNKCKNKMLFAKLGKQEGKSGGMLSAGSNEESSYEGYFICSNCNLIKVVKLEEEK